jgi:hypothetical protein
MAWLGRLDITIGYLNIKNKTRTLLITKRGPEGIPDRAHGIERRGGVLVL